MGDAVIVDFTDVETSMQLYARLKRGIGLARATRKSILLARLAQGDLNQLIIDTSQFTEESMKKLPGIIFSFLTSEHQLFNYTSSSLPLEIPYNHRSICIHQLRWLVER